MIKIKEESKYHDNIIYYNSNKFKSNGTSDNSYNCHILTPAAMIFCLVTPAVMIFPPFQINFTISEVLILLYFTVFLRIIALCAI
jgi:hypothetical protein